MAKRSPSDLSAPRLACVAIQALMSANTLGAFAQMRSRMDVYRSNANDLPLRGPADGLLLVVHFSQTNTHLGMNGENDRAPLDDLRSNKRYLGELRRIRFM